MLISLQLTAQHTPQAFHPQLTYELIGYPRVAAAFFPPNATGLYSCIGCKNKDATPVPLEENNPIPRQRTEHQSRHIGVMTRFPVNTLRYFICSHLPKLYFSWKPQRWARPMKKCGVCAFGGLPEKAPNQLAKNKMLVSSREPTVLVASAAQLHSPPVGGSAAAGTHTPH